MGEEGENLYVWGTNLTINGITKRVRAFYKGFKADDADGMPKYEEMLREVSCRVLDAHHSQHYCRLQCFGPALQTVRRAATRAPLP